MGYLEYMTPDCQHPDTGIPCNFTYDDRSEILYLEPCELVLDSWGISHDDVLYKETERLCRRYGKRTCSSLAEANRIIKATMPRAYEDGAVFDED